MQQPTFSISSDHISSCDLLIIPLASDCTLPSSLSPAAREYVRSRLDAVSCTGAWGCCEIFAAPEDIPASMVACVGIGDASGARRAEGMRRGVGAALQDAGKHAMKQVSVLLPGDLYVLAGPVVESVLLSQYKFVEHSKELSKDYKARRVSSCKMYVDKAHVRRVRGDVKTAKHGMDGVWFARDLVNQPASHMSPATLARHARAIARSSSSVTVTVMNKAQAKKAKFTAFLEVARGSKEAPCVIHLKYKPKKKAKKKVALVGKAITFDSGGLSLKPGGAMEDMKIDMAGAATVMGLFSVLEELQPDVEVHGIMAACENMPSGDAYRPGDVVRAMNGKTIEVLNTDAEGRITLADALTYAAKQKPDAIIDLATLTGAVMIALGDTYAGLWSNNRELQDTLMASAAHTGEGLEDLPLPEEYRKTIRGSVADVRNLSSIESRAGATTAALFLQEFVSDDMPWAHIDMAGPAYMAKPLLPYFEPGATGYGVRTLAHFLKQ